MKLKNKIAIITGSTKGIGKSIAEEMARQGAKIVITGRNSKDTKTIVNNIKNNGGTAIGLAFDIENYADLNTLIDKTIDEFGGIDILVNNALSHNCFTPLNDITDQALITALTTNISHTLILSRLAHKHLKKTEGNIINIASVIVKKYLIGLSLYSIIKAALLEQTKILAVEWGSDSVRVNAINPGFIKTSSFEDMGMSEKEIQDSYHFYKQYNPLRKTGSPPDIGKIAAYLASEDANFISGAAFDIDAGYSIHGLSLYNPECPLNPATTKK